MLLKNRLPFIFIIVCSILWFSCGEDANNQQENDFILTDETIGSLTQAEIISYWNGNDTAVAFINDDVNIVKITYKTIDTKGNETEASGAILLPSRSIAKGVISIQHATFFDDNEAPSENGIFSVISRKSIFASNGYIVLLPDYLGYGIDNESIHPYHHASSLKSASADMLAASYEYLQIEDIQYDDKLFLAGYSEGAYATAALQQHFEDVGTTVTASSLGSGAYDLKRTVESFVNLSNDPYNCMPCNAFFIQAYNEVYSMNQPMSFYFQEPYDALISDGLLLGTFDGTVVNTSLPNNPALLFQPSFVSSFENGIPEWESALTENNIHNWIPQFPALITHNISDNVVPFFNSENLATLNANNPNLHFVPIENSTHFSGILFWGIYSLNYFNEF